MSAVPVTVARLIDRLPPVRGRLTADAELAPLTWLRVGGRAEVLFQPEDVDDLAKFLSGTPDDIPVTVIGLASNLLIRDGGVPGVTIRLGRGPQAVAADGDLLHAGAGASVVKLARDARDAGIAGFEFLSGIPGSVGGGLRGNAGAHGAEIGDRFVAAAGVDRRGNRVTLDRRKMGFAYRGSTLPDDVIVTGAVFRGVAGDPAEITRRMDELAAKRAESQPQGARTGGSTFKNPPGHKAWELIDRAGCRGLRIGDAQMAEKHCNFLLNLGNATAADVEDLGEEVRRRVAAETGVELEWEIKRVGTRAGSVG